MADPKRFLVTGMQGFVGQKLTVALRARFAGCEVFGLGADGINGMVESAEDTRAAAIRGPQVVFHLAARSSVAQSGHAASQTVSVNLGGTLCLAQALRADAPGAVMVYASSGETYGNSFLGGAAAQETLPLQPNSPYARSKAAGEWAVQDALSDQAAVVSLRLFNHSGAGQDERFVLPSFAAQIAQIEAGKIPPIIKVGNLSAQRDFLHVDDVIDGYIAIAERALGFAHGYQVFNVCSGNATKIEDLLTTLIGLSDQKIEIEIDPNRLRPSDIPCAFGDNSQFKAHFGWTPKRTIETMLKDVLDEARLHHIHVRQG
jgi:GDP-4-dehydro-6-deoxy-D-mannose reductase